MTVAASRFTLPLAMLHLKVRGSGELAVCLKTSSCPLWGFLLGFLHAPIRQSLSSPNTPPPDGLCCPCLLSKFIILLTPQAKRPSSNTHYTTSKNAQLLQCLQHLAIIPSFIYTYWTFHSRPVISGFLCSTFSIESQTNPMLYYPLAQRQICW